MSIQILNIHLFEKYQDWQEKEKETGESTLNYAIILSGGTGTRLGLDIPKQYYKVNNKFILEYVLDTIEQHALLHGYIIVAAPEWQQEILAVLNPDSKFIGFAQPGVNRQLSIYNGLLQLAEIAKTNDLVLVQDAARPNTSMELLTRCLCIEDFEDGAMPVLPMKDTVYLSHDGKQVDSLLNRQEIFAGQAPESFRFGKYLQANEALLPEEILKINGSTEPAVRAGMRIAMIEGEEQNYKITTAADLEQFCKEKNK